MDAERALAAINTAAAAYAERLTKREIEVWLGICQGQSNKEIAANLGVRPFTARTHVASLFQKTGVQSRTELVIKAWEADAASDTSRKDTIEREEGRKG